MNQQRQKLQNTLLVKWWSTASRLVPTKIIELAYDHDSADGLFELDETLKA